MNGNEIDMRMFAQRTGASVTYPAGSIVFTKGDPAPACTSCSPACSRW
jgi:hypothetical protein